MPKPAQLHCSPEPREQPLGLPLPGKDCSASLSTVWECCARFGRDLSLLSAACKQCSKKKNQHHLRAAEHRLKTQFPSVTHCGNPACSLHFAFHKKQHLSVFNLAEKSSIKTLGCEPGFSQGTWDCSAIMFQFSVCHTCGNLFVSQVSQDSLGCIHCPKPFV